MRRIEITDDETDDCTLYMETPSGWYRVMYIDWSRPSKRREISRTTPSLTDEVVATELVEQTERP